MCRILLATLIGLFCFGPTLTSVAQRRQTDSPEVLKELLALPAPLPRHAATPTETTKERAPEFFDKANPPADDAPIVDLVAYWTRWINGENNSRLTDAVRQRLLDFCLEEQGWLTSFLPLLPQTDSTRAKVKEIYDKARNSEDPDLDWCRQLKDWLLRNSTYFLDELLALAQKAKDNEKEGHVTNEDDLKALAKLHWSGAEPLLRSLMATGQPRSTAVALALFYLHAIDEKDLSGEERYRRELQATAVNRNLPAYARKTAIEALSLSEWSGRDDWYLGLFQEESLLDLREANSNFSYSPLTWLPASDPDKWIPVIARLMKSDDVNVRSAAVTCLLYFSAERARKDALVPLLPWLTNPSWVKHDSKLLLIQGLSRIDVPESVPGLIALVDNNQPESVWEHAYAAKALARYKDPRAAPALRRLLAKEKDQNLRPHIIDGLVASGGLSLEEQLQAVEAYAVRVTTEEGRLDAIRLRRLDEEPLSLDITIGHYLATLKDVPESLVSAVLARAEAVASEYPLVSKKMIEVAHDWQGSQVERDMIRRIANGSADATMIKRALSRKAKIQESLRNEAQGLAAVSGAAQGIGAVLLDDALLAQEILTAKDETAQIGLLVCSRHLQMELPVTLVGPILRSKNQLLSQAAEAYLLAEDSREARELLWQHHPNEAFVTGWLETLNYPTDVYPTMRKSEAKLRDELLKEGGPIEILALVSNREDGTMVLRIYPNKAVFTEYDDSSRHRMRTVPKAEVESLKDYLAANSIAERGPTNEWCYESCPSLEFLSLTKEKGRRVLSNTGFRDDELYDRFVQLADGDGVETHYDLEREIKGLEVLYADDELLAIDVWRQGKELRVLVERPEPDEEIAQQEAAFDSGSADEEEPSKRLERRRRTAEANKARFTWRVFANSELGAVTTQPDFYPEFDGIKFLTDDDDGEDTPIAGNAEYMQVLTPDSIIMAQDYGGLWKQVAGAKPVRITDDGIYARPIVTRDRKWAVVAKTAVDWSHPNYVVRYNLQTGREFRVNLEPADDFEPIAFIGAHNKVLLRRDKAPYNSTVKGGAGPDRPEYYLLDASTGATRLVTGEFEPLRQKGMRALQRTEKPDEFWVALADNSKNRTRIGRYDTKDFSFKLVMEVPHLAFDSFSMYVDEKAAKIYVVYKGQLLRLPLQPSAN